MRLAPFADLLTHLPIGSPRAGGTAAELEPRLDADGVGRTAAGAGGVAAGVVLQPLAGGAGGPARDIRPRMAPDMLGGSEGDHGLTTTQSTTEVSATEDDVIVKDVEAVRVPVSRKPLVPPGV